MSATSTTELLTILRDMLDDLARSYTVRRIGLFGSCARGDQQEGSDVDVLVEFDEPTFDHYMDLKFRLEEAFGRQVDLVLADTVKPRLKPVVDKEAVYA